MQTKALTKQNIKRLEWLGIYIRELRRNQGMTQKNLCEELNLDPKTLIRAEAGKNITLLTAFEIADALNIDMKQLFEMLE